MSDTMRGTSRERRIWAATLLAYVGILASLVAYYGSNSEEDWVEGEGGLRPEESQALQDFVVASRRGGLDELDREVKRFAAKSGATGIHPDLALYFVQDQLEPNSLEQEFLAQELRPAQDEFRSMVKYGSHAQMRSAFTRLRSRVINYELGPSEEESLLGEGARVYLRCYHGAMGQLAQEPDPEPPGEGD